MSIPIENIRHSFAHLLAAAVKNLYPKVKFGIGPTIENGFYYDFDDVEISEKDLPKIEKEMVKIAKQGHEFKKEDWSAEKAREHFKKEGATYKLELIDDLAKAGSDPKIGMVHMGDVFLDLCRGGHVGSTKDLPLDAFKLTRVAGAYWKGSEKNTMLTRIYGVAFNTKKELDQHLKQQEEAKKRDHRILGERLKLFTFADEVGPGLPLWLPNGTIIRDAIEQCAKEVEREWGYKRVTTPHIAKEELYKISGHIPYYADAMYPPMQLDDGNYYLKPMNCPMTHMIYKSEPRSYRDLPLRFAEYGTTYRYELSGTLAGLLRVRGFTQNDAHIYCREDQAEEEFLKVMKLHQFWYEKIFEIKDYYMRLSLPDEKKEKYVEAPKDWKKAVSIVRKAMKRSGLPYKEKRGEAAFYGPKVDFQIKSAVGREESASTNQLDFLAAKRLGLTYKDKDGKDKPVYVIHRAPLGSHERFIAFLIEHYAGSFPLWLAPEQIWIVPVSEKFNKYAHSVEIGLQQVLLKSDFNNPLRTIIHDENETLGKKIREGQLQKIPYLLVVGEKEQKSKKISIRHREKGDIGLSTVKKFVKNARIEIDSKK